MCTNFKTPPAADGSIVVGRSLDYPYVASFSLCATPRDLARAALGPNGAPTKTWTTRHGVVGIVMNHRDAAVVDGMNTAGLSAHVLYMVGGFFVAPDFRGDGTDVSQIELASYLLSTCANIDEVRAAVADVNIWAWDGGNPFTPPIHVLVHDSKGSAAIEFQPGGVVVVDNPTSVGTNSPYLEWHLLNLNNYTGFSAENKHGQMVGPRVGGMHTKALGVGSGLHGIPGDYSGVSRFVRAIALTTLADTPRDGREAEMLALHVLNTFDVPSGVVKEPGPAHSMVSEITYVCTIANLTDLRFAYRALDDPTVYVVDLNEIDFGGSVSRFRDLNERGDFTSVSF